jgi:hypothetical protein
MDCYSLLQRVQSKLKLAAVGIQKPTTHCRKLLWLGLKPKSVYEAKFCTDVEKSQTSRRF